MRLTALARKLNVSRDKLIHFLRSKNIEFNEGINAKLPDEIVQLIEAEFIQEEEAIPEEVTSESETVGIKDDIEEIQESDEIQKEEVKEETVLESEEKNEEVEAEIIEEVEKPELENEAVDSIEHIDDDSIRPKEDESLEEFLTNKDVDVIKVKKIKLEGVKVVGKIDLPEPKPKVKEEDTPEELKEDDGKKVEEKKAKGLYGDYLDKRKGRHRGKQRRKRPALSYKEKQDLEDKKYKREREKQIQKEKERKKEHYQEKVKPVQIESKPKKKRKSLSETQKKQEGKSRKKGLVGRFWSWLNGEYDNF